MLVPDYTNGGLVNLMASIALAVGAPPTGHPPLEMVAPEELEGRKLVLLVMDGLGDAFLGRQGQSRLKRHRIGRLSSVFPTTTATAITTFATGLAPRAHGVTGWFTYFRELGSVAAVLPFRPRHGGAPYSEAGITPAQLVGGPPLTERATVPCHVVSPHYIVDSDYSRTTAGTAERHGYRDLWDFFDRLHAIFEQPGPSYTFAYWPELDARMHRHGTNSREVSEHFATFDKALAKFLDAAAGSGATLLVTADHGVMDTQPSHALRLEDHPPLADYLMLPLCGDPRVAFCYLREGRRPDFVRYVESELKDSCQLVDSRELVSSGYFGPGATHPRLHDRSGDVTLIMRDNYILRDRLPTEKPYTLIGVHGGLSAEELYVPLARVDL